ncbi:hypothetical protein GCM10023185_07060 [Hymenobacter saemangeumensis]|uniref:BT4734-like N-terminal domain-containing protein n=1 Tax=Hymenobacter saemangeumensis TaxID=1084522 RepID=A0ABP8I298_9BACT
MMVSLFSSIQQITNGTTAAIEDVLGGIQHGEWREVVEQVRTCETKTEQREAKKRVPYFTVSGTFSKRNDAGLLQHSGMVCLDIDADKNPGTDLRAARALVEDDDYTFAVATSISGLGWFAIVRIPTTHHEQSFRALAAYYLEQFGLVVDSLPDVSRPRFVSYDPHLYYNPEAEVFAEVLAAPAPKPTPAPVPASSFQAGRRGEGYGPAALRTAVNKVLSAPDGQKHYTLNKMAFLCGGYVAAGLLSEAEAREQLRQAIGCREVTDSKNAWKTIDDGLKAGQAKPVLPENMQRIVRQHQREESKRETIIQTLAVTSGASAAALAPAVDAVLAEPNPTLLTFWRVVYKEGKRAAQDTYKLLLDRTKLRDWLRDEGFSFRPAGAGGAVEFLHTHDNIVRLVERYELKQHVIGYVEQLPPRFDHIERDDLLEAVLTQVRSLFDKEVLDCLPPLAGQFLTDDATTARYFFRNCWVEVTATGVQVLTYTALPGLIWESQVRPHDFVALDHLSAQTCDFHTFTVNITGGDPLRLDALQRAMGYLLHGHKDDAQARAVIFVDQVATAGQPAGGTGKSLLMRAIGELVKVTQLPGATFRFDDDFRFALVEDDTRIAYFDEWDGRRLPFKKLFTEITSDMVVNRKNKPQIVIPFARSPKFAITTNDMVAGQGSSHERRKIEIALAPHYSERHTPKDEFGTGFFNQGWDASEYKRFFNLALGWVQQYLAHGLLLLDSDDIQARKIEQDTSPEFVEFAQAVMTLEGNPLDNKLWAADLYNQFIDETGESRSRFTLRHFMKWMERFGYTKVRNKRRDERQNQFFFIKPQSDCGTKS